MTRFHMRCCGALFSLLALFCSASHAGQDDDFLGARDAFNARNANRLDQYARKLSGAALEPFVRYWQLFLHLDDASVDQVREVQDLVADSFLSDRLRAEWLKVLGKRRDWAHFTVEYPLLINEDPDITCYALQARIALFPGDTTPLSEARRLWFNGAELPSSCTPLFAALIAADQLSVDDVYARLRLALEAGNISVARSITEYLPEKHRASVRALDAAADNPARFLKRADLSSRGGRELALFAVHRIARTDPLQAVDAWKPLQARFEAADQAYEAGQLGLHLARRHEADALTWFAQAKDASLSDLQLGWMARAAMRAQDWPALLSALDRMSGAEQQKAEWRYWRARGLRATGKPIAADALLAPLSREHHYYGQLASEDLSSGIGPVVVTYKPSEEEIKLIAALPSIQRALALYRLSMRSEGMREWNWTVRRFDDRQLLAAAELARRNEIYDRAISTADRTQQLHDFSLRFPSPHREAVHSYAESVGLDDAWIYGLVRQESRFVNVAKSGVGASGLMQLMPATARWVAKKLGLKSYSPSLVNQIDTNIQLGTYYLKHVYDSLGHPVLATAAYNAGPGRARRWQNAQPMDATAYIESIPFNETRDYVKKVMSNSAYYAQRFGEPLTSLKKRIGVIPARGGKPDDFADEP